MTTGERRPRWRSWFGMLGPGLVTGASDDDPSGVATYAQTGAQFGYSMVWAAFLTFPLVAGVQEICDRTALATGVNLGELTRRRFARTGRVIVAALLIGLLLANTINIAADVMAVGAGMHLLHLGPEWFWAIVAGVTVTAAVLLGSFELLATVFKFLSATLLAFVVVLFFASVDWWAVLRSIVVPHIELSADYVALLAGVLGTTISPYLFFWQSAHRVEEIVEESPAPDRVRTLSRRPRWSARATLRRTRADVFIGFAFSNIVMFAIIVACAATLHANGTTDVASAAEAAAALEPIAGHWSSALFALGFIGSGMLAVPVLAGSASSALAGLADRDWGFDRSLWDAPLFYGLVLLGTAGGTILTLIGFDPIRMLVVAAIVNGVAAAPFLVLVMLIAGDRSIMGEHRNHRLATVLGWATVGLMSITAIAVVVVTVLGV